MLLDERLKKFGERCYESLTDLIAPKGLAQHNRLQQVEHIHGQLFRRLAHISCNLPLFQEVGEKFGIPPDTLRNAIIEGMAALQTRQGWHGANPHKEATEALQAYEEKLEPPLESEIPFVGLNNEFDAEIVAALRREEVAHLRASNDSVRVAIKILRVCEHNEKWRSSPRAHEAWDRFTARVLPDEDPIKFVVGVVDSTILSSGGIHTLQSVLRRCEGAFRGILPTPNPFQARPESFSPLTEKTSGETADFYQKLHDFRVRPERLDILLSNVEAAIRETRRIGGSDFYAQFREDLPEYLALMRRWNKNEKTEFVKTIDSLNRFARIPFNGSKLTEDAVIETEFAGLRKCSLDAKALFVFCLLNRFEFFFEKEVRVLYEGRN